MVLRLTLTCDDHIELNFCTRFRKYSKIQLAEHDRAPTGGRGGGGGSRRRQFKLTKTTCHCLWPHSPMHIADFPLAAGLTPAAHIQRKGAEPHRESSAKNRTGFNPESGKFQLQMFKKKPPLQHLRFQNKYRSNIWCTHGDVQNQSAKRCRNHSVGSQRV